MEARSPGCQARVAISHLRTAAMPGLVVATVCLLYSGWRWALPVQWAWVGIGTMGIGENGVATPDSARVRSDAERQLSPAALVVAALVCAIASAAIGSMLSGPTAAAEYSVRLTASGLTGEARRDIIRGGGRDHARLRAAPIFMVPPCRFAEVIRRRA